MNESVNGWARQRTEMLVNGNVGRWEGAPVDGWERVPVDGRVDRWGGGLRTFVLLQALRLACLLWQRKARLQRDYHSTQHCGFSELADIKTSKIERLQFQHRDPSEPVRDMRRDGQIADDRCGGSCPSRMRGQQWALDGSGGGADAFSQRSPPHSVPALVLTSHMHHLAVSNC